MPKKSLGKAFQEPILGFYQPGRATANEEVK